MEIKELNITSYDANTPYDPRLLVFTVHEVEEPEVLLHFPQPDRGRDAELDFDDCRIPFIMFEAMLGRQIDKGDEDKFFAIVLPEGTVNG